MITREDEYITEIAKLGGFALIAPFGKVLLSIPYIELSEITVSHILYIALTLALGCIGTMMIFSGKTILREGEE